MNSQIKSMPYIVKTVCYEGIPRKIIQNGLYNDAPRALQNLQNISVCCDDIPSTPLKLREITDEECYDGIPSAP